MHVKFYESDPILQEHILMFSYVEISVAELSKTKFLPDNATSLTLFLNANPSVKDFFTADVVNHRITFSGQYSKSVLYTPEEDIRIINIDFLPWGAYSIFGKKQSPFHNVTSNAAEIFPRLLNLIPELEANLQNDVHCKKVLEKFLITELRNKFLQTDRRIVNACHAIAVAEGKINIKNLCKQIGMSHSSFTKYFTDIIGINPKLFGRITRFTAVQNFLGENPDVGWSDIVYKFDYFDQNHFIREFKQFTGAIPKDRRKWEALFDPLKMAIEEGFETDAEQMKRYRDLSLYQILHYIPKEI